MRESREGRETGERTELGETNLGEGLRSSAQLIVGAFERGEDYRANERPVIEALREFIETRLEDVIGVVGSLQEAAEHATPLLGEFGGRISEGLGFARDALEHGLSWLREHPEVFEAALQLVVVGAVAVYAPSAVGQMLAQQPEILLDPLRVIAGYALA